MPEKPINVRAIPFLGLLMLVTVMSRCAESSCTSLITYRRETMELFAEMAERRPSAALAARKVGQVGVKLLRLFGDFRTLLKPLR